MTAMQDWMARPAIDYCFKRHPGSQELVVPLRLSCGASDSHFGADRWPTGFCTGPQKVCAGIVARVVRSCFGFLIGFLIGKIIPSFRSDKFKFPMVPEPVAGIPVSPPSSTLMCLRFVSFTRGPRTLLMGVALFLLFGTAAAFAQGGPPYYTNDPGTPGHLNWEINIGYMPFLYSNQSVSHTPDVDINFGVGDRIQLTYENAWLRVQNPGAKTEFGMGQSNPGVKWRFYDAGENGLAISVFPQFFLNNPNDAVRRGITPATDTFLLPFEFSKKFGPIDVDYEIGYQAVHKGPDGWITGLVLGHEFTKKFELDAEFYSQGTFHPYANQPTFDFGGRYKIHSPVIVLVMAGRSFELTRSNQSYFVGYFGLQFLLPPKSYNRDEPNPELSSPH
jgi:hypothetical protein